MTLTCTDLSLTRGGALVLDRITTALEPGTITAIVGPNGAGKSSLLMALAGLLAPAAGQVGLGDQSLNSIAPRERAKRIGYLPQSADIAWDVAVENLVALGRMPHRDKAREPVEAAIEAARLRLRPILMTSLAFILGVVPLMTSTGAGAELRQVIGTTVFSGMLGVTFFGLIFTPLFYVFLRELRFGTRKTV